IECVELIFILVNVPQMNGLTGSIVHQPVFVILKHRRPLRDFERRRPNPEGQAEPAYLVADISYAAREMAGIGRGVFTARVLIALIHVEVVVAEFFEMFSQPARIRERGALAEAKIIGGPTPPAHRSGSANTGFMELADSPAIGLELGVVVRTNGEHQALSRKALAGIDGHAESDLIFGRRFLQ